MRRRPGRSVSCGTAGRSVPGIWWCGCGRGTACCWSRAPTSGCRTTFVSASARSCVTCRRRSPRRNEASSARSPTEMRVVPLEAFRDKIPFSVAIAAVERGFAALGRGEAELPDPMVLEVRAAQAEGHVKGAQLAAGRPMALKVATGFYRNRARGLPSGDGMFLLLDADTGVPAVLLEEHGYLTDFRTAAAVAVTLKYLAPKDAREALLVGGGARARLTARAMIAQMPLARLTLWNRSSQRAMTLARELSQVVETRIAPALESAVRDHRVIVTATASTTPLIMDSWVGAGTHVTSVGTGSPEKIELEPALLARADKLVADRVFQTERYGNLHHAVVAGAMTRDKVYAELGALAAGRLPGRASASEITVADLTGVGVQDAAIAQAVVEALGL